MRYATEQTVLLDCSNTCSETLWVFVIIGGDHFEFHIEHGFLLCRPHKARDKRRPQAVARRSGVRACAAREDFCLNEQLGYVYLEMMVNQTVSSRILSSRITKVSTP